MSEPSEPKVQAAIQHAELLVHQNRFDDALTVIDEALAHAYDDPELLRTRGWVLIGAGQDAAAIGTLESVLGVQPDDTAARYLLSHARMNTGDLAGAQADARACLEAAPQSAEFHLLFATALTAKAAAGRRVSRHNRKLARQHVETGLGLDPENAELYFTAAVVQWRLDRVSNLDEATALVEQGLAIAPDHKGLLGLRADLVTAAAMPTNKYDQVTRSATEVTQVSKLLAQFPQHTEARRVLFHELWTQRMLLIDAPLSLLPILVIGAGAAFHRDGLLLILLFGVGFALALGAIRVIRFGMITGNATPGFRRQLFRELPASKWVHTLNLTSWAILVAGALAFIFVRDAVAIRYILFALGISALIASAASIVWQLTFATAARRVGGFVSDADSLNRFRAQRSSLTGRITLRLFGIALIGVASFALTAGRQDALPIVWLGCGAMLLSPAVGAIALHLAERNALDQLTEGTTLAQQYRPPGIVAGGVIAAMAVLTLVMTVMSASQLPMLPNEYDTDQSYVLRSPGSTENATSNRSDDREDDCRGRPAARLACIIDRGKERAERGWGPEEIAELPDLGLNLDDEALQLPPAITFDDTGAVAD